MAQPPICDYDGSDYQLSFWEEGGRVYEDRVEAVALARLLPPRGKLLLEIGAGAGRNTPRYQNFERVVLLDYSLTQLQQAQERLGRSERFIYVSADAYRLPFSPGLFDTATMIRTLHHMADVPRVLNQVHQALQPRAIFILEYANKRNLKAMLRFWFGIQSWNPFDLEPVEFAKLNFDFHPCRIREWLSQSRFFLERQLAVSYFRLEILKRFVPISLLVAMDGLAQWTGKWWQFSPSVFVRARAVGDSELAPPGAFFRCLQCDASPLEEQADRVICPSCGSQWQIKDGIYVFR
jgi:SAM-dependent methyltransferase